MMSRLAALIVALVCAGSVVGATGIVDNSGGDTKAEEPVYLPVKQEPNLDCVVSNFSNWTTCSASCGAGTQTRTRFVLSESSGNGTACPPDSQLTETQACNGTMCPVDCVTSPDVDWKECSVTCGGGIRKGKTKILVEPQYGGRSCELREDMEACNTNNCPIDCQMSPDFMPWTPCSSSCGNGTRTRSKAVLSEAQFGGKPCSDYMNNTSYFQHENCNPQECPRPCFSVWSNWSDCSATCGENGIQVSLLYVESGNPFCPSFQNISQTRECNRFPCPIDCVVNQQYGNWSTCSSSCGGGNTSRVREILHQPAGSGGLPCPSIEERTQTGSCNTQPCPVNCVVSNEYSNWTACSAECGGGYQFRHKPIITPNSFGGTPCPQIEQRRMCNTDDCPQAVDCILTNFTEWTPCSKSCGGGTQERQRVILQQAKDGGVSCPADVVLKEEQECFADPCPIDCEQSPWSPLSACSAECGGGVEHRTRNITTQPMFGGGECGPSEQTQNCNLQVQCKFGCEVTPFGVWSECSRSCGNGIRLRRRTILINPADINPSLVNASCPVLVETENCNPTPCALNCSVTPWSSWSECSQSCGTGGERMRSRQLLNPFENPRDCELQLEEFETCNNVTCPVDCLVSDWSEWEPPCVECGVGEQSRVRTIIRNASFGGASCPPQESLNQTRACSIDDGATCNKDCVMSNWTAYSPCSVSCGSDGVQERSRVIISPSIGDGQSCGELFETIPCTDSPACPMECQYSDWGWWTDCSCGCAAQCGLGYVTRSRTLIAGSLANCTDLVQSRQCLLSSQCGGSTGGTAPATVPVVVAAPSCGEYREYSPWSRCTPATCSDAIQSQTLSYRYRVASPASSVTTVVTVSQQPQPSPSCPYYLEYSTCSGDNANTIETELEEQPQQLATEMVRFREVEEGRSSVLRRMLTSRAIQQRRLRQRQQRKAKRTSTQLVPTEPASLLCRNIVNEIAETFPSVILFQIA